MILGSLGHQKYAIVFDSPLHSPSLGTQLVARRLPSLCIIHRDKYVFCIQKNIGLKLSCYQMVEILSS